MATSGDDAQAIREVKHQQSVGTAMSAETPSETDITTAVDVAFRVARARNLALEDCEDLAQTVAERLLRQEAVPDNVAAWAQRVAKNAIIDLDRKRKARDEHDNWVVREVGLDADDADGLIGVAQFVRNQRSISAQGMQRQAGEEMMALLRSVLSTREIEVLVLLGEGRTHAEIAEELDYKNADTVKSTLKRLRDKTKGIADRLAEFGNHPRVY